MARVVFDRESYVSAHRYLSICEDVVQELSSGKRSGDVDPDDLRSIVASYFILEKQADKAVRSTSTDPSVRVLSIDKALWERAIEVVRSSGRGSRQPPQDDGTIAVSGNELTISNLVFDVPQHVVQLMKLFGPREVVDLLLRYQSVGLGTPLLSEVDGDSYDWISSRTSLPVIECFASPLDKTLSRCIEIWKSGGDEATSEYRSYCSLFERDKAFGSMGDFFSYIESVEENALLLLNPPDIGSLITAAITASISFITRTGHDSGAIFFLRSRNSILDKLLKTGQSIIHMNDECVVYKIGTTPDVSPLVYGTSAISTTLPGQIDLTLVALEPPPPPTVSLGRLLSSSRTRQRLISFINNSTGIPIDELATSLANVSKASDNESILDIVSSLFSPSREKSKASEDEEIIAFTGGLIANLRDVPGLYIDVGTLRPGLVSVIGGDVNASNPYSVSENNRVDPAYGITFIPDLSPALYGKAKLVTAFMTLQKFPNLSVLEGVGNLLMPGGLFIFKERSMVEKDDSNLIIAQRMISEVVVRRNIYRNVIRSLNLFIHPYSLIEKTLTGMGFKLIKKETSKLDSSLYLAAFSK